MCFGWIASATSCGLLFELRAELASNQGSDAARHRTARFTAPCGTIRHRIGLRCERLTLYSKSIDLLRFAVDLLCMDQLLTPS